VAQGRVTRRRRSRPSPGRRPFLYHVPTHPESQHSVRTGYSPVNTGQSAAHVRQGVAAEYRCVRAPADRGEGRMRPQKHASASAVSTAGVTLKRNLTEQSARPHPLPGEPSATMRATRLAEHAASTRSGEQPGTCSQPRDDPLGGAVRRCCPRVRHLGRWPLRRLFTTMSSAFRDDNRAMRSRCRPVVLVAGEQPQSRVAPYTSARIRVAIAAGRIGPRHTNGVWPSVNWAMESTLNCARSWRRII